MLKISRTEITAEEGEAALEQHDCSYKRSIIRTRLRPCLLPLCRLCALRFSTTTRGGRRAWTCGACVRDACMRHACVRLEQLNDELSSDC